MPRKLVQAFFVSVNGGHWGFLSAGDEWNMVSLAVFAVGCPTSRELHLWSLTTTLNACRGKCLGRPRHEPAMWTMRRGAPIMRACSYMPGKVSKTKHDATLNPCKSFFSNVL